MSKEEDSNFIFWLSGGVLVFLIVVFTALMNSYIIDEGERAVLTKFGTIEEVWEPGFHVKLPFVERVKVYNTRVQKSMFGDTEENKLSAYSNDQQIIDSYRISVTWQYDSNRIKDVYKFFKTDDEDSIFYTVVAPTVQQTSKQLLGQFTATTIIQERSKLDAAFDKLLKDQLAKYPINVISVQIEDVSFSESYDKVVEQTAQKKMEIEKARNELQRIEIESKQQIAKADAENKAIKLQADAKAYQIKTMAQAEADAISLKANALKDSRDVIDLTLAEKWDGKMPQTMLGDGSKLVPILK